MQPDDQLQLDLPTPTVRGTHISFDVIPGAPSGELLCGAFLPTALLAPCADATCPECRSRARFLGLA